MVAIEDDTATWFRILLQLRSAMVGTQRLLKLLRRCFRNTRWMDQFAFYRARILEPDAGSLAQCFIVAEGQHQVLPAFLLCQQVASQVVRVEALVHDDGCSGGWVICPRCHRALPPLDAAGQSQSAVSILSGNWIVHNSDVAAEACASCVGAGDDPGSTLVVFISTLHVLVGRHLEPGAIRNLVARTFSDTPGIN